MNCDFIAPWYRVLEYLTFGTALQRRRREYLEEISGAKRVLILGDGDGRFTAEFLKRNRAAKVDCIDVSPGMMRLAERRIRSTGAGERVRLLVADALRLDLAGHYDVVVTHYFLDCLSMRQANQLVERVSGVAMRGARWVVSEFQVPQRGPARVLGTVVIGTLYVLFRILTGLKTQRLPRYAEALERNGFLRVRHRTGAGGLLVSELWEKR